MNKLCLLIVSFLTLAISFLPSIKADAGWNKQPDGSWTYTDNNGKLLKSSWLKDGNYYYNFDINGYMRKNTWLLYNDKYYYFDEKGRMYTGTAIIENKLTIFDTDGAYQKTVTHIDGLEDDVLATAVEQTTKHWESSKYALDGINAMRREKGLVNLELSLALSIIANYRNAEMQKYNYFDHEINGEVRPFVIGPRMFKYPATHGENIYKYTYSATLDKPMSNYVDTGNIAYKNSPGHYSNIITSDFRHVGLGVATFNNNSVYYTQIFSRD